MARFERKSRLASAVGAWLLAFAHAPVVAAEYDCLVTARSVVEVGAARTGVLAEVLKDRGDTVAKGEVVARFDVEIERLVAQLSRLRAEDRTEEEAARARVALLRRKVARAERLATQNVTSESERDDVETDLRVAMQDLERAQLERQAARIEFGRAKAQLVQGIVRSPVSGVVIARKLEAGEFRDEQTHILTVAALDPLYVEVFAPIDALNSIAVGQPATVTTERPLNIKRRAKVAVVDPVIDAASGTFGIRLEMPNAGYSIPAGLRCKVTFH